jgi:hypothetical protein
VFKQTLIEPSTVITDSIYELIYQQTGRLTSDWGGKNKIVLADEDIEDALLHIRAPDIEIVEAPPAKKKVRTNKRVTPPPGTHTQSYAEPSGGGCGGLRGGGCG